MTNNTLSKKEKDILRKQQHSEIERKRRLKVNKRFDELRELVSKDTQNVNSKPTDFKLQILDQTVDYINQLKSEIEALKGGNSGVEGVASGSASAALPAPTTSTNAAASPPKKINKEPTPAPHKLRTITPPSHPPPPTDETIVADVLVSLSTPESPFTKLGMSTTNKIPDDLALPPPM